MSRWLTFTCAGFMALVAFAAPAQAGPLQDLPVPTDIPTSGDDYGGIVNDVRGHAQQLVHDSVGNEPTKTLALMLDYAREVQERAKKAPDCVKLNIWFNAEGDIGDPDVTYDDNGDSHATTIDLGKLIVRVTIKDCAETAYEPESGPFP